MSYKGVDYHYAFEFNVPLEEGSNRTFNIAISDYRDKYQNFAGLCLDNEIKVISIHTMKFAAFCDIINQIIELTIQSEKMYTELNPGKKLIPLMTVAEPDFLAKFEKSRELTKSLDSCLGLKESFEGVVYIPENSQLETIIFYGVYTQCVTFVDDRPIQQFSPQLRTNVDYIRIRTGL
jgi:hypothetical protein